MTQENKEKLPPVVPLLYRKAEKPDAMPQSVELSQQSRTTLTEILQRPGQSNETPEDVVAMAVEVFNVITEHLSKKDSRVILHTVGESPQTLDIKRTAGSHTEGVRTVYRSVEDPRVRR